jgi:catechol 2,3-dioxygenase-like lactoylglutathione lyase family enzyme
MSDVGLRIGSIVVDCNDFPAMLAFWQAALGYEVGHSDGDFAILRDPAGRGPNVSIDTVPEPRVGKNRLHFDLYTEEQEAEVARLLSLGAKRFPRTPGPDDDFIVLEDPEGNLFCVVDTTTG